MSNGSENLSHGFLLYVDDLLVLCLETDFLIHFNLNRSTFLKISIMTLINVLIKLYQNDIKAELD